MAPSTNFHYPQARRDESAGDVHFGTKIPDPYRWTEFPDLAETKEFVAQQNALSTPLLHTPTQEKFLEKIIKLNDYPKYSTPARVGSYWVFRKNSGVQNQDVLYIQNSMSADDEANVLIDPNTWTEDGTAALGHVEFTEDGSLLAYARSDKGSDWKTIHFMTATDKEMLPDVLKQVKFSCLIWTPGNEGVFYNRYDASESDDGTENTKNVFQKLYYHKLGTPQSEDVRVMTFLEAQWMSSIEITPDHKYLVLSISKDCKPVNQLWVAPMPSAAEGAAAFARVKWVKVVEDFSGSFSYVANDDEKFLFHTNKNAPMYKLVEMDITQESSAQKTIIEEDPKRVLEWVVAAAGDKLVCHYSVDVKSALEINKMSGELLARLPIPIGSILTASCERKYDHLLVAFTSFNVPKVIYQVNMLDRFQLEVYRSTELEGVDFSGVEVTQEFYEGKDGTRIPMFITSRRGIQRDGKNPTLLYGYGGFSISLTPSFVLSRLIAVLYLGMTIAVPNIRGGGEYGIQWYEAAIKENKQVSYDDFQSAAEYLIAQGYTSPQHLAIMGGSNGGLMVGACLNQRPDLFRAVVAQVGVMDLLRFHKFTIGHAWTSDYGNPDVEDEYKSIIKISPLHNISSSDVSKDDYPAVLVLTADHDDRVSPFHSLKYIAELQFAAAYTSPRHSPIIARVDVKSGHGAGKPLMKALEEVSEIYGFLAKVLGLSWNDSE